MSTVMFIISLWAEFLVQTSIVYCKLRQKTRSSCLTTLFLQFSTINLTVGYTLSCKKQGTKSEFRVPGSDRNLIIFL